MSWRDDLTGLLFPVLCAGCSHPLVPSEEALCTGCAASLPRTRFHARADNDLEKVLWGRIPFYRADAFLHMTRKGLVHDLIHEIKYRDNRELGLRLGSLYGREMVRRNTMGRIDVVVPVPLHPRKLRARGYNQSELIAAGMNQWIRGDLMPDSLVRVVANASQTRLSRFRRWMNVSDIFSVPHPHLVENKHVLLVDDVITTGSTIEACSRALMSVPGITLSVACIAFPVH